MKLSGAAILGLLLSSCTTNGFVLDRKADASGEDSLTRIYDHCAELPQLATPPKMDGVLDEGLALVDIPDVTYHSDYPELSRVLPTGFHARFAAAWHAQGVYVFFAVTDDNRLVADATQPVWQGDGVEVYVDDDGAFSDASEYDNPGTTHLLYGAPARDQDAGKPRVERTTRVNMPRPEPWPAARVYALATATGYVLEAVVTALDLDLAAWSLQPNMRIGFNVGINASLPSPIVGSPNRRAGSYVLRTDPAGAIPASFPFNTNAAFCTPTLR